MPWKETTTTEQEIEFIAEWRSGQYSSAELCRAFGISRPTVEKYSARFKEHGIADLLEFKRNPRVQPNKTPQDLEQRIISCRPEYPRCGGEKISKRLHQDFHETAIPAVSTVNRLFMRKDLVYLRKRLRRVKPVNPIFNPHPAMRCGVPTSKASSRWAIPCTAPLTIAEATAGMFSAPRHRMKNGFIRPCSSSAKYSGDTACPYRFIPTMAVYLPQFK